MTTLLEKAVKKISALQENEQDEIAGIILEEIQDEELWNSKFNNNQNELSILSDEALSEFKKGNTKSLDI